MLIDNLRKRVRALELDLSGSVVLTEAATGAYAVTAVIAALAGAKVYAYARNTRYGTVQDAFAATEQLLDQWQGPSPNIVFVDELSPRIIGEADIITNSGHLRPLDEHLLQYARKSVVIPLMYEAWEWRETDMDLTYIRKRGLRVVATNERHPDVNVFNFLGDMALRQIMDAGLCLYDNRFVLLCNNDFGPFISKVLARVCAGVGVIDRRENKDRYALDNVEWLADFPQVKIPEHYADAAAVIFTAYPFDRCWIGDNGQPVSARQLKEELSDPLVLRYAGDLDCAALSAMGIRYFPAQVCSGHMGVLPSALGYEPVIRLQAGGLKSAEAVLSGNHFHKNISILQII